MRDKTRLPTWKEIETSTNLYFKTLWGGGKKGRDRHTNFASSRRLQIIIIIIFLLPGSLWY